MLLHNNRFFYFNRGSFVILIECSTILYFTYFFFSDIFIQQKLEVSES